MADHPSPNLTQLEAQNANLKQRIAAVKARRLQEENNALEAELRELENGISSRDFATTPTPKAQRGRPRKRKIDETDAPVAGPSTSPFTTYGKFTRAYPGCPISKETFYYGLVTLARPVLDIKLHPTEGIPLKDRDAYMAFHYMRWQRGIPKEHASVLTYSWFMQKLGREYSKVVLTDLDVMEVLQTEWKEGIDRIMRENPGNFA